MFRNRLEYSTYVLQAGAFLAGPKNLDATDGLAAAVCHFYNSGKLTGEKNYSGWSSFIKQNENRLKK